MKLKLQKNNKLFYGKWPYKIECAINGADSIRFIGAANTLAWCNGEPIAVPKWGYFSGIDKPDLAAFIRAGSEFIEDKENFKWRAEGRHFNFFCKTEDDLNKIKKNLKRWIIECYGPRNKEELEFLMSNNKKVLCDALPFDDFVYKVYVKEKMKDDARIKFYQWAGKQGVDKIKFTGWNSSSWFSGQQRYMQNPFFYVKDLKTMSMVSLFLGDNIKVINEHVVRDALVPA
jgi:hypothetical protein